MFAHLHPFKVRNGTFNVPVVVLQTVLRELQVEARAENDVLHPPALWLGLQMNHKKHKFESHIADKVDRFDGRRKTYQGRQGFL